MSIPTDDDSVRARFEPGAPIDARIDALARLRAAGLRTFVTVQPMLPMNASRMVDLVAPHANVARVDRMYAMESVRHLYDQARCPEAITDAFFERTGAALREGFAARGVYVDDLATACRAAGLALVESAR